MSRHQDSFLPNLVLPVLLRAVLPGVLAAFALTGCGQGSTSPPNHAVIPVPVSVVTANADPFLINASVEITHDPGDNEARRIGVLLADLVGNTRDTTPAVLSSDSSHAEHVVQFTRIGAEDSLGAEGYVLSVTPTRIVVRAASAAGMFYGLQTIRQLLPPFVEYGAAYERPLPVPAIEIRDSPRFGWRGAMLDVSRHFIPAPDVKRFIDLLALYKMNRLHLHLSDDQGWRIEIPGRPRLTEYGATTQVGGKGGGFFTREAYADLVQYAADRFVTVVPEIDLPGHTNAALASYPELNCDGVAPALFEGTAVGFSSVCVSRDETYEFIDDVIREIAAMTPGPYFHVGGDEVETLTHGEYVAFVETVQQIVARHGKTLVGWDEVASADLNPGSRVQLWRPLWRGNNDAGLDSARAAAAAALRARVDLAVTNDVQFIISPADRIYLDMKYDTSTVLGLTWAGLNDVRDAYDWDISDVFAGIPEHAVAGVEAPIWTESISSIHDIEYMAFPRLPGVAELGWSRSADRQWSTYQHRLAAHGPRWTVLGVNYRRAPEIPWVRFD